jgi:catechol 2,3-dioxygenase
MDAQREPVSPTPWGEPPDGYRLPAAAHPGRVVLQVTDLGRSLDWYRRVLGFDVVEGTGGVAVLTPVGDARPLVELRERKGAGPVPPGGRLGLYHYAILLPDRAALGRFLGHVARLEEPVGASDHLVSEALYLKDPDGLGVEVYADRPRSSWSHRGRQLVMATDPLDLQAVVRAGGGEPWRGMPPGTVIGHIHLHVGDLDAANAFYHRGLGLDRVVWSYPGALFLAAGGYHHHLGVNTWARGAAPAAEGEARLVEWEILVPGPEEVASALRSLEGTGHAISPARGGGVVQDPWGTALRIRAEGAGPP